MMVFKRKQIVILSLVLMIIVAGYLQYSYKKGSVSTSAKDSGKLGEAVYVDYKDVASQEDMAAKDDKLLKDSKSVKASKQANDFFAQAKLDKEIARGRNTDALKEITDDVNASKETKSQAYEQMMNLIENSDKEMRIETMIKERGFEEVVALFGDDGSLDIVVKSPVLTSTQAVQIADVVSRQANVRISDIHIKNLY